MHSEQLEFIKLSLRGIGNAIAPLGTLAVPITALAEAALVLIDRVEAVEGNKEDLEDLAYEAGTLSYQYIITLRNTGELQQKHALFRCIQSVKSTIDEINTFVQEQKEQDRKADSRLQQAKDWLNALYHAEGDKTTIANLRNRLRQDSNVVIFAAALVTLVPAIDHGTQTMGSPSITANIPLTRPGRKPGDLIPYLGWIKLVIIKRWGSPVLRGDTSFVLDLACGGGRDLYKWRDAHAKAYIGFDHSKTQVASAQKMLASVQTSPESDRFNAYFARVDCFNSPLSNVHVPFGIKFFDVVSIQVSMHFVWKTEKRAKRTLRNVAESLRRGGLFIGTMFNDEQSLRNIRELPSDRETSFGNTAYKVSFPSRKPQTFGRRYTFSLFGTAENRHRFLVPWDSFMKVAEKYGLRLKEVKTFKEIFEEEFASPNSENRNLLRQLNVIDTNGCLCMDTDQWEAANMYIAFAFIKP